MVIIPKEKIREVTPTVFVSKGIIASLAVFGVFVLSYLGLFYYRNYLITQKEEVRNQIEAIEEERSKDLEQRIIIFDNQINNLKNLLTGHLYWSQFFDEIERLTLPRVSFSSFRADVSDGSLSMKGQTTSYGDLARQIVNFTNHSNIRQIRVSDVLLKGGGISFTLDIIFSKNILTK